MLINRLKTIDKYDIKCLIWVAILYIMNYHFKKYSDNYFMHCYFNDLICPFAVIAYINIWFTMYFKRRFRRISSMICLMFVCGIFLEYIGLNPNRVTDWCDIVCYEIGGIASGVLYQITKGKYS